MVTNITPINDSLSKTIRTDSETRGLWYYMLMKSAGKHGLDREKYARGAIYKLGQMYRRRYPDTDSLPVFVGAFFSEYTLKQFHAEIKMLSDDEAFVHFNYCPMMGMWSKLTDDPEDLALVCDCAMDVDRGTFDLYEHIGFELGSCIARGAPYCELHMFKK
jgi:hypothetical protein